VGSNWSKLIKTPNMSTFRQLFSDVNVFTSQSVTAYSMSITDKDNVVNMTSNSANEFHIANESYGPANANFPIGSELTVIRVGQGITTFTSGSGVTLNSKLNLNQISNQYTGVTLLKTASNEWYIIGNVG
jgi:hypothetical protein